MYENFYGLKEIPFALTPDTEYLYRFGGHQEALNVILVALRNGEGFIRITGEVGTGKTLLCRHLLTLLQDSCTIAYLPNPLLTPLELYQAICSELKLDPPAQASFQELCQLIFAELVRLRAKDRPLVIMIDEAQAMSYNSLEALRLLSNLETEKEKLLHILFFGQPEFEERLQDYSMRQLRQRITFAYKLKSLSRNEVAAYLEHRLKVAGCQGGLHFSGRAVATLFKASRGVPRLVNLLAHKALLAGYGKGRRKITGRLVAAAVCDSQIAPGQWSVLSRYMVECCLVVAGVVAAVVVLEVLR